MLYHRDSLQKPMVEKAISESYSRTVSGVKRWSIKCDTKFYYLVYSDLPCLGGAVVTEGFDARATVDFEVLAGCERCKTLYCCKPADNMSGHNQSLALCRELSCDASSSVNDHLTQGHFVKGRGGITDSWIVDWSDAGRLLRRSLWQQMHVTFC